MYDAPVRSGLKYLKPYPEEKRNGMSTKKPDFIADQSKWEPKQILEYNVRLFVTLALLFVIYFIFAKTPLHEKVARPIMEEYIHYKIGKTVAAGQQPWHRGAEWKVVNFHPYKRGWVGEISVSSSGSYLRYAFYYAGGHLNIRNPDELKR